MLRFENVATPFTGVAVSVPDSTPPGPALFAMAIVTGFVAVVTTFPDESSTLTCTGGVIEAPAATFDGWTVNATFDGGRVTVKFRAVRVQSCVAVFTGVVQLL
jgi:hypothetical protein